MKYADLKKQTENMIDDLKAVCRDKGLGNDGNEFLIITQVFLYKFINDKFAYEIKQLDPKLQESDNWEKTIEEEYSEEEYELLLNRLGGKTAKLQKYHYISHLFNRQNNHDIAKLFDNVLSDIGDINKGIFSIKTGTGEYIRIFEPMTQYISDSSKRNDFCRAILNKLIGKDEEGEDVSFKHLFDFEDFFIKKYDFFSTIFEYLIKEYNNDGGGKYAEYYTPHAVAKIMSKILVPYETKNVKCYDPAAGTGTLLISLAHAIGENRCTIYAQDISQKTSRLLRLNLILNSLTHSIQNIIQDNTILNPYYGDKKFDYIVSNPPFRLDFSDWRNKLENSEDSHQRFFAGIPPIPKKDKTKMAIYTLFIQHIIHTLSPTGKAAIVVPTGFITAQRIELKIRKYLVDNRMLSGVVSMPSNIFATTSTNVSILFLDKGNTDGNIVLMDASALGEKIKDGKSQKTVLTNEEEQKIIDTYNNKEAVDDLSVVVSYEDIEEKNYSFSAGQYFDVKIEYTDITKEEFELKMNQYESNLKNLFKESNKLETKIIENISDVRWN